MQLIKFGELAPTFHQEQQTASNKVPGCLSNVYVYAELIPGNEGAGSHKIKIDGTSNALITAGLIHLLSVSLTGCSVKEINDINPDFMKAAGFLNSLSRGRNNGVLNMLELIKKKAIEADPEGATLAGLDCDELLLLATKHEVVKFVSRPNNPGWTKLNKILIGSFRPIV
eukprot:GHVL01009193.1.p2 GENE.GHVL01009193.1~~GHVL01009193.1.p2  ORF type:complete len:170 (-),score=28.29 GHVL01009193.1:1587-2096(-)